MKGKNIAAPMHSKMGKPLPFCRTWREIMYSHGLVWWPVTYHHTHEEGVGGLDQAASWSLREIMAQLGTPELWADPNERGIALTGASWAESAFPSVRTDSKYASALMSTRPPIEGQLHTPWKCFLVEVPAGLAQLKGRDVRWMWVHEWTTIGNGIQVGADLVKTVSGWTLTFCPEDGTNYVQRTRPLEELRREDSEEANLGSSDARAVQLLTRMALNLCIAMCDIDNVKKEGLHPRGWARGPSLMNRASKQPTMRSYVVGRPVVLDCRPAVREYLEGKRSTSPTVQFLVRGHWRNQACGPKMLDRKLIWVEPYWKGPEDAPINVRPHNMGPFLAN